MKKGGYGIVYQDVMRNENLSIEAKAIYAYLSSIAGVGGTCYPSLDTIQKDLGISRNRISKHMSQLTALGVVEKVRERTKTGFGPNVYKVTHEVKVAEELQRIFQTIENSSDTALIENVVLQNEAVQNEAVQNEVLRNEATNNNNININSINNNNINNIISPESDKSAPNPSGILLLLNDKSFYDVPLDKIATWQQAYPAVDVKQELQKMRAWLESNPKRCKTRNGITRFINTWLSKEQDKGGIYRNGNRTREDITTEEALARHRSEVEPPECPDGPFK